MSVASSAVVGVLAAAAATVSLWRGAEGYAGPVRHAYRWLAGVAGLWGAGVIMAQILPAQAGTAAPLSFADIPPLLAVPVMVVGMVKLASPATDLAAPLGYGPRWRPVRVTALVADGLLTAGALFLVGWATVFSTAFDRADMGAGAFALDLARPLADLVLLGVVLSLATAAGRRGVLPYLAAMVISVGDWLVVGARLSGTAPGVGPVAAQIIGCALLALAPWSGDGRPRLPGRAAGGQEAGTAIGELADSGLTRGPARLRGTADARPWTGQPVTTVVAASAVGVAALVMIAWALLGRPLTRPVVPLVAGAILLALVLRVLGLIQDRVSSAASLGEASWEFQRLADRTSDAILLCDVAGVVRYASRAVAGFGYTPEALRGKPLAELLHPEDRAGGTWAVRKAVSDPEARAGRYPCRVRAADGTWRHVEATVSRYRESGGRDQLLVTARDVSDKVALRRQVTHLTYHDGLTGLPNRAYVEQRARETLGQGTPPSAGAPADEHGHPAPGVAGVIFVDLDGFTAVNDEVGHSAGDVLLSQVAHRLRSAVPAQDTLARWGGDQFAVLMEDAGTEEVIDVAERLARCIASAPCRLGDRDIGLTASVGVAFRGDGPAGHVWRNAALAMARAKALGTGRVEVFGESADYRQEQSRVSESETKLLSG